MQKILMTTACQLANYGPHTLVSRPNKKTNNSTQNPNIAENCDSTPWNVEHFPHLATSSHGTPQRSSAHIPSASPL